MKCTAHKTNGEPCNAWAIKGAKVCRVHGGMAPQVQRKAAERIAEVRDLAVVKLLAKIEKGARDADARVLLAAVKDLSELVETMEGRVARREGVEVEVEDANATRDSIERKLACISERSGADQVSAELN